MAVSEEDDQGWSTAQTFKIPDENANSHIMIGLEEWMRYQVRVASYNRMGYSAYSSSAETTTRESGKTESVHVNFFYYTNNIVFSQSQLDVCWSVFVAN